MGFTAESSAALPPGFAPDLQAAAGDPVAALRLAPALARELGMPGGGNTRRLWEGMAAVAAIDLTAARTLEPHLDALAILAQAHEAGLSPAVPADATWGVFAAEGPGARLTARRDARGWRLDGRKAWCSLAGALSHALVTAWTSERGRTLFAVALDDPGVRPAEGRWVSRGLSAVETVSLDLVSVPALPVGGEDWYLSRPGFALGGIGVAAVWWGAACALAGRLRLALREREPDQIALLHLGRCDAALHAAGAVLAQAADEADRSGADPHAWPAALRVRCIVHDACETVLTAVAHTLGPGPLTQEEEHARRVADLQVYLRQHKAERDLASVGEGILAGLPTVWDAQ